MASARARCAHSRGGHGSELRQGTMVHLLGMEGCLTKCCGPSAELGMKSRMGAVAIVTGRSDAPNLDVFITRYLGRDN